MTLGPVVTGARLAVHEAVRTEQLAVRRRAHRVHGAGLKIDENRTGHIFAVVHLIVVDVNAVQLHIVVAMVVTVGVDAMLVGDDFPELSI